MIAALALLTLLEVGEEYEGVVPRKLRDPRAPTNYEVEHHNFTHIPYRNWCPTACVGKPSIAIMRQNTQSLVMR